MTGFLGSSENEFSALKVITNKNSRSCIGFIKERFNEIEIDAGGYFTQNNENAVSWEKHQRLALEGQSQSRWTTDRYCMYELFDFFRL